MDLASGLVLTNRHVVGIGPVVTTLTFYNKEEVDCVAVYRDPIHDFGFLRYDPASVKFATLDELTLRPDLAIVGCDVRVIGNDAGEKLSILSGTLARVDKTAPNYGIAEYSDFNVHYLGASSNTSGGSSGSPVVDIFGNCIGLNAGGQTESASSYYLPLHSVVNALQYILRREPIPRGCITVLCEHQAYNALVRLGLSQETERRVRDAFPEGTGMLVVQVLAGAVASVPCSHYPMFVMCRKY